MRTSLINLRAVIVISILSLVTSSSFSMQVDSLENQFYYGFGEKVPIEPVTDKIIVKKSTTLMQSNFEEYSKQLLGEIDIEWNGPDFAKIELKDLKNFDDKIAQLLSDDDILSVRNVYRTNDKLEFGFSNEIIIKFKDNIKDSEKIEILKDNNLTRFKTTKIYEAVKISKYDNIIEVANNLYETGYFVFAYPSIICKAELFSTLPLDTLPNDTYFQYQITCHNTGQTFNGHSGTSDADIDAPEAWDISLGDSNIVIAVFDAGVTSNHPDLPNTRQIRLNGSNFGSGNQNDPSPTGDENHGNACSGVIAATMNNNQGIAGIAPKCKIMPIRWDDSSISVDMVDGIEFAVDSGANIISNSWGYGTANPNHIPALVSAIQYAIDNNVVVVFAAGNTARHYTCNDTGYVTFPANANVNSLLTVGASDRYDNQSDYSPTSYLIDIVAPSHRAYPPQAYSPSCGGISGETLEMWSIDIPGNAGYNTWPSDPNLPHPPTTGEVLPDSGTNYLSYTGRFGGTSHACPVVAAVAALLLSEHPNMTPSQIFDILTASADTVGNYTYSNGRCDEMGYGRVNANSALQYCNTYNFDNQSVTSNITIEDCIINIQDVEVSNNSKLTVEFGDNLYINGEFEVVIGSELEIKSWL